jgi:phosphoglycerate dehydrogenase-like enzyme
MNNSSGKVWSAFISSKIFRMLIEGYRERLIAQGIMVKDYAGELTEEQLHVLCDDVDIVFGPGFGFNDDFFKSAKRLKVISLVSSGYECINLKAATNAGVVVTNAPTPLLSEAVADLTFGLMLDVSQKISARHCSLFFEHKSDLRMGTIIYGKTIGVVGLGNIGKAVAKRAIGFGMRILAFDYDEFWDDNYAEKNHIQRMSLDGLLQSSDFVSLHLRETQETIGIIGERELSFMKSTSFLINTARQTLVDEQALYYALYSGNIAGAGLDTIIDIDKESPLLSLPNVVGTPHVGGRCVECAHEMIETAIENAVAILNGHKPRFVVNDDVYNQ